MRMLTGNDFHSAITATPVAVVHFDAEWDVSHRPIVRQSMLAAERAFGDVVVTFGEVDVDRDPEVAMSLPLGNVPTVAYFRDGRLVAALIGSNQDVVARTHRVLRGEPIGYDDGTTPTPIQRTPTSVGWVRAVLSRLWGR